jgi:hypothetical protein
MEDLLERGGRGEAGLLTVGGRPLLEGIAEG